MYHATSICAIPSLTSVFWEVNFQVKKVPCPSKMFAQRQTSEMYIIGLTRGNIHHP